MFSQEPRRRFGKPQLMEVICQLRFPEILTIGANVPVDYQEAIRGEYPQYKAQKDVPAPRLTGAPGHFALQNQPEVINYRFVSADGVWRVNLTSNFISLSCARYTTWEDFAQKLDLPLASFIKIYKPAYFERVGLRYINAFSRKSLDLEGVPFRELFQPCYLGVLAEDDVQETATTRSSMDLEMQLRGGARVKLHAGPGMVKRPGMENDKEVRFILDNDLFMSGNIPVNLSAGAMQTLHQQADSLFLGAITERLRDALEPAEYL